LEQVDFEEVLFQSANWVERLDKIVELYNNTPKALTGVDSK